LASGKFVFPELLLSLPRRLFLLRLAPLKLPLNRFSDEIRGVYLMDGSLLRDWVFIGKPGENGVFPRGWVSFAGLAHCQ
jgi:hypothetical protein